MNIKPLRRADSIGTTAIITIPKIVLRTAKCEIGNYFSISSTNEGKILLERVDVIT